MKRSGWILFGVVACASACSHMFTDFIVDPPISDGGATTTTSSSTTSSSSTSGTGGGTSGCVPGSMVACYSGPSGTEGVGQCIGGMAVCGADGGPGPCVGEVTPAPADNCALKVDATCDGLICGEAVWSYDFQGPMEQDISGITTDASGNIYLAGKLSGSITFGTKSLVSAGGFDAFVAKLDQNGVFVWGGSYGDGPNNQAARSVAVDSSGNVVFAGWFLGSMTVGNATASKTLTTGTTNANAFVAKLSPSGSALWAFSYGAAASASAVNGVAVDFNGDVLITGYFSGAIDFGQSNMTAAGPQDLFVAKLAGATGAGLWNKQTGSVGLTSSGNAIAVDGDGNSVAVGTSGGAFVQRLDASGDQSWGMGFFDSTSFGNGVALDGAGSAYVTGTGTTIAPTGPTFVTKLDVGGNQKWTVGAGATAPFAIAADTAGDTFIAGSLDASANFGGGVLTGPAFLWKLNPDGSYGWSRVYGTGTGTSFAAAESCRAVAVAPPSFVIVGCENYGSMDFGADAGPVQDTPPTGGFNSLNITLAKIAAE